VGAAGQQRWYADAPRSFTAGDGQRRSQRAGLAPNLAARCYWCAARDWYYSLATTAESWLRRHDDHAGHEPGWSAEKALVAYHDRWRNRAGCYAGAVVCARGWRRHAD